MSKQKFLPCLERVRGGVEQDVNSSVIWLHGLGADGSDFEPLVPEFALSQEWVVRFVFPHAPSLPITINGGSIMPAWYDIKAISIDRQVDEHQLRVSASAIDLLVQREIARGVASDKIIVAGFSQGGAVALEVALRSKRSLAGLMSLSSYFATLQSIRWNEANANLPILVCHGTQDPIVPEQLGKMTASELHARGYPVEYKTYPMAHSVCEQQIADIGSFINSCFSRRVPAV